MGLKNYHSKSEAVQSLEATGYTHRFSLTEEGLFDHSAKKVYPPEAISLVEFHRFLKSGNQMENLILYVFEAMDGNKGLMFYSLDSHPDLILARFLEQVKIKPTDY
jgi:hypothetical protein